MVYAIPLWQELSLYAYVTLAVIVFVLLSKLKVFGLNVLRVQWRVIIALFSPLILVVLLALAPLLIIAAVIFFNKLKVANKSLRITIKRFDDHKEE